MATMVRAHLSRPNSSTSNTTLVAATTGLHSGNLERRRLHPSLMMVDAVRWSATVVLFGPRATILTCRSGTCTKCQPRYPNRAAAVLQCCAHVTTRKHTRYNAFFLVSKCFVFEKLEINGMLLLYCNCHTIHDGRGSGALGQCART